MDIDYIESELTKLIKKAAKNNEVPVGAIIMKNNKIISKAYNKVNSSNDILNHAEVIAIKKAAKKLKNWRLDDCYLYVTLEPCSMCKEIIKKSRINSVYYFIKQNNNNTEKNSQYIFLNNNDNFKNILQNFFKERR